MATILKRTLADGSTRYDAQVRRAGVVRKKSHRTRVAALAWARKVEAAIDEGQAPATGRAERRTLGEVLARYCAEALPSLRDSATPGAHLRWWSERLGTLPAAKVGRGDLREGLAALERGESPSGSTGPATRRRYLASLRAALGWAVREDLLTANPAAGVSRAQDSEPPGRVRFLTDEERGRLLAACDASTDSRLGPLVRLALATGARQAELLGLTWQQVDLSRGLLSLPTTKAGRPRSVAVSTAAAVVLRELWRVRGVSPYVFAGKRRPPTWRPEFNRKAWERAVQAAGLVDLRFHDLRHTFASYLLTAGASLPELAAALGHSTIQMVSRYSHLEKAHGAALVERVAARLAEDAG